jgi:hypothetical protein
LKKINLTKIKKKKKLKAARVTFKMTEKFPRKRIKKILDDETKKKIKKGKRTQAKLG